MVLDSLIGRKFTRIKYGKQHWQKEIKHVFYEARLVDGADYREVKVIIIAKDGSEYYLDEVGLV